MVRKGVLIFLAILMATVLSMGALAQQVTTINFWTQTLDSRAAWQPMAEVIAEFEKANPDIKVKVEHIPFAQFDSKLIVAAEAGSPPDISDINWMNAKPWAQAGYLEPLDDYIAQSDVVSREMYYEAALVGEHDGQLYTLPQGTGTYMMFYNKDLFEKHGVAIPQDWNELVEAIRKLYNPPHYYGLVRGFGDALYVFDDFVNFVVQNDGYITDEAVTRARTDEPAFVDAFTFYVELVTKHNAAPPGYMEVASAQAHTLFAQEKAAMLVSGPWARGMLATENPDLNWGIFRIPGPEPGKYGAVVGGWQFGIWKGSKNKEAAWRFLEFISRPENAAKWASQLNLPWVKEARNYPPFSTDSFLGEFAEMLAYTRFHMPASPKIPEIAEAIHIELQMALLGMKTPKQATDALTQRINQILAN